MEQFSQRHRCRKATITMVTSIGSESQEGSTSIEGHTSTVLDVFAEVAPSKDTNQYIALGQSVPSTNGLSGNEVCSNRINFNYPDLDDPSSCNTDYGLQELASTEMRLCYSYADCYNHSKSNFRTPNIGSYCSDDSHVKQQSDEYSTSDTLDKGDRATDISSMAATPRSVIGRDQ